jgi:hypothetical protein
MKVTKIEFGQWKNTYRCEIGSMELTAVADIGPRVLSLSIKNARNILFEDTKNQFQRKNWRLYGGHRFWVGPETEQAFAPANSPCKVSVKKNKLSLTGPTDSMGLQKTLEISQCRDSGAFIMNHIVENVGTVLYPGCIWTLTCALPGRVVVPWAAGSGKWQCNMVRYWKCWENHTTDPASRQWHPTKDYFMIDPTGEEGKVGLYTESGLLAFLSPEYTFIKTYKPIIEATYPDGGCNVELYTCKHFVEMETLSPNYVFHPGKQYCHTEHWLLTEKTFEPEQWEKMKELFPGG